LAAVAGGWYLLTSYALRSEQPLEAGVAERWPAGSALQRNQDGLTVLLFLHPKCPCSKATLAEIEQLTPHFLQTQGAPPKLVVVATTPKGADESWLDTETIERARALPFASIFVDEEGAEAQRFGAVTSGLVLCYDAHGERSYAGGVTVARGHEGDNAGCRAVESILKGERNKSAGIPAFGCRLCLPGSESSSAQALKCCRPIK
jgi:hypothetical protein